MERNDPILLLPSATFRAPASRARENEADVSVLSGTSAAIAHLRAQMRRIAPYFRTASLTGERGCGDEAVARALHEMCPLNDRAFLALNATDAEKRFATENGPVAAPTEGLLYLPEAEALSRTAQAGLLRLLREQNSRSPRVVAFVGRGLKPLISAGFFSPELAGTLGALRIALPELRDRTTDIPLLLHDCLQETCRRREITDARSRPVYLSDEFLLAAMRSNWPGNLHQMQDVVDWLLEHKTGGTLNAGDLQAALDALNQASSSRPRGPRMVRLEQVVQQHIREVLMGCNGNKLRAAEVLGISRSTLYRMLESSEAPESLRLAG